MMSDQVMLALIGLIKEGGYIALWGIFLYQGLLIVKAAVIGLFVLICTKTVCAVIAKK